LAPAERRLSSCSAKRKYRMAGSTDAKPASQSLFSASGVSRDFVLRPAKDAGGEGVCDSPVRGRARTPGFPANRVDDDRDREALRRTRARDPLCLSRRWSSQQAPTWRERTVPP
jgi:hypothetical protein